MKKTAFLLLILSFLFAACKKDKVNTEDIRLTQVKNFNIATGYSVYSSFEYDQAGRITKVFNHQDNNSTPLEAVVISYSNNQLTITPAPIHNSSIDYTVTITYSLDAGGRPLQRIENMFTEYKGNNQPQRDFKSDTAMYEYDAPGLLAKITGKERDSTWFNPGTIQTETHNKLYTTVYTNSNGNVDKIAKTTDEAIRADHNGTVFLQSLQTTEQYEFAYTHGYQNKTDFTNALVLTELQMFYPSSNESYYLDKSYKNFPDHITYSRTKKDMPAGTVIDNDNFSNDMVVYFDQRSFITGVRSPSTSDSKYEFSYNQ